jgi:hypothetical protein
VVGQILGALNETRQTVIRTGIVLPGGDLSARLLMRNRQRIASVLWLLSTGMLVVPCTHAGGNMRCGEDLIQRGHTFFEVVERCGKPDLEYAFDFRYAPGVYSRMTEWVYELGMNKFRRVLTFEEGRLRTIELRPKPEISLETLN